MMTADDRRHRTARERLLGAMLLLGSLASGVNAIVQVTRLLLAALSGLL